MATLDRSVASLRVMGDDLRPTEVSALLGASPTFSYAKGEVLTSKRGASRTARFGLWSLDADEASPADLDAQVMGLLARMSGDDAVWQRLRAEYDLDLFCGWFMEVHNEGTSLEPETLSALGSRGIALSLDIYAP